MSPGVGTVGIEPVIPEGSGVTHQSRVDCSDDEEMMPSDSLAEGGGGLLLNNFKLI